MEKIRIRDKHPGSATLAVTVDTTKVKYTVYQNLPYASINIRDDVKHDNFLQMKKISDTCQSPHRRNTGYQYHQKELFCTEELNELFDTSLRFFT